MMQDEVLAVSRARVCILGILLSAFFISTVSAEEGARRIILQAGSQQSLAAIRAVEQLNSDPGLRGVHVVPLADRALNADELLDAGTPAVVLTARHGGELTADLDAINRLQSEGVAVVGLVPGVDPRATEAGARFDPTLAEYYSAGGATNLVAMVRHWLDREGLVRATVPPPTQPPASGFLDVRSGRFATSMDEYMALYRDSAPSAVGDGAARIGLAISRSTAVSDDRDFLLDILNAFESRGLVPVPFFNYPAHRDLLQLLADEEGHARVEAIAALAFKLGVIPDELVPALASLDVPVVSGIVLRAQSEEVWRKSATGVGLADRAWQIGNPELAGAIAPTVIAGREQVTDQSSGLTYLTTQAISDRVDRWADRLAALTELRRTPALERRIAVIYYNYPPGRENVGASYLNVLPESLSVVLDTLQQAGYDLRDLPSSPAALQALVKAIGINPQPPDADAMSSLVENGEPLRVPIATYRQWFAQLPETLQRSVVKKWGEPEQARSMLYRDGEGELSFLLPALRFGNVLLAPQPTRGWDLELDAAYHDVELPPHHAYIAFYLWLQKVEQVHAMLHLGTHATHEWLPGKEVGLAGDDASDVIVGAVPQVYPYIVDNVGEGQQAKRRGMAALVSHMTPPLSRASLNPSLQSLSQALSDYTLSVQRGSSVAEARLAEIAESVRDMGLDVDLGLDASQPLGDAELEALEHHIQSIRTRVVPFGLHTFGVAPDARARRASAEAIADFQDFGSDEEREVFVQDIDRKIRQSADNERAALLAGLAGRYIAAGPGHDPIANPESLPTGRNFYGFDPSRLPVPAAWEEGQRLVASLIADHRAENEGEYPRKMVFNLFSVESNRHEGVQEAQILSLLGVEPQWDPRGKLSGVRLVPRNELGRPRVDVTVLPSGLYRDVFGAVLEMLDDAVSLAASADEPDNPVALNVSRTQARLLDAGVGDELAARLSRVRIFGTPTGAYGPGLETPITAETSWSEEAELADVYFSRIGHLFGQGFWGERPQAGSSSGKQLAIDLFRGALSGADAVVHSRSSNLYGVLDNDDFYQALGGAAMAVRVIDGTTPATRVTDLSDPRGGRTVALERYLGQELQSRYLNPEWIDAMLDEGYAGARFVRQIADNLWGWQVTVPDAVGASRWQSFHEVYVEDRYDLDIVERIEDSGNLEAYAELLDRLESVVAKAYWSPDTATVDAIREASQAVNARLARQQTPAPGPLEGSPGGAPGPPAPVDADRSDATGMDRPVEVSGRRMETVSQVPEGLSGSASSPLLVMLVLCALCFFGLGWWRRGTVSGSFVERAVPVGKR